MGPDHITLLRDLSTPRSENHSLYYYQGNFYYPMTLSGADPGRVKKAIRIFTRENKELIEADRAHPNYKTKIQLFDEQEANI